MKNEQNQYYRAIRRCLPCSGKQKQQIMDRIQRSVSSYMDEDPLADFSAIEKHFGTPQQIAHAYIEEMGTEEIANKFNIRKTVIRIVSTFVILALLLWGLTLASALIENNKSENGFYETSIVEN